MPNPIPVLHMTLLLYRTLCGKIDRKNLLDSLPPAFGRSDVDGRALETVDAAIQTAASLDCRTFLDEGDAESGHLLVTAADDLSTCAANSYATIAGPVSSFVHDRSLPHLIWVLRYV